MQRRRGQQRRDAWIPLRQGTCNPFQCQARERLTPSRCTSLPSEASSTTPGSSQSALPSIGICGRKAPSQARTQPLLKHGASNPLPSNMERGSLRRRVHSRAGSLHLPGGTRALYPSALAQRLDLRRCAHNRASARKRTRFDYGFRDARDKIGLAAMRVF